MDSSSGLQGHIEAHVFLIATVVSLLRVASLLLPGWGFSCLDVREPSYIRPGGLVLSMSSPTQIPPGHLSIIFFVATSLLTILRVFIGGRGDFLVETASWRLPLIANSSLGHLVQ
jgi:hypothetical protein